MMQLGAMYQDVITGFKGIATGHVKYITGCNQVLLQPPAKHSGEFVAAQWFDEQRVERIDDGVVVLDNSNTPGFDVPAPK